jgi:hypothetical protein
MFQVHLWNTPHDLLDYYFFKSQRKTNGLSSLNLTIVVNHRIIFCLTKNLFVFYSHMVNEDAKKPCFFLDYKWQKEHHDQPFFDWTTHGCVKDVGNN